jgi:hypothetical protein
MLEKDGVLGDFKRFKDIHNVLWNPRMFSHYPEFFANVFRSMLSAEGAKRTMKEHVFHAISASGINKRDALKDAVRMGVRM